MDIFVEVFHENLWGKSFFFFGKNTKADAFYENRGHNFLDIDYTLSSKNISEKPHLI